MGTDRGAAGHGQTGSRARTDGHRQRGSRARPCEASLPMAEELVGSTHKNATLFTSSAGPGVIFFANDALSAQRCRGANVPLLTNTKSLAICACVTRCGLAAFSGPFLSSWFCPHSAFFPFLFLSVPTLGLPPSLACLPDGCPAGHQHSSASPLQQSDRAPLPLPGIPWVPWEGPMQKAALTRKSCPCQSIAIGEPPRQPPPVLTAKKGATSLQGHPACASWGPRTPSVTCIPKCDTGQAPSLQTIWQMFIKARTSERSPPASAAGEGPHHARADTEPGAEHPWAGQEAPLPSTTSLARSPDGEASFSKEI